jgi:hypothetical protein
MCPVMDRRFLKSENPAPCLPAVNWTKALIRNPREPCQAFGSKTASPTAYMDFTDRINRRLFLSNGVSLGVSLAAAPRKNEFVYRFQTPEWDIRMIVEFHDRYASRGFWFNEDGSKREYCLSATGEEARNCLGGFAGSLAVAQYRIRPRSRVSGLTVLREHVRTIDQDDRLKTRAPFERAIALRNGIASDIQVFGYEPGPVSDPVSERNAPWCLLRQDLYFDEQRSPFLVVHWKHALSAIRVLDIVPGGQTLVVEK